MRRVIPGFKSDKQRGERQVVREERVEHLEDAGVSTGGFEGGRSARSTMSPALLRRLAEADAEEAYAAAKSERQRSVRAEAWRERSEQAARERAVVEAVEAGLDASPRALRGEQLGHSPAEFLQLMSARQDHEDMLAEARRRQEFYRWQQGQQADSSGDLSAPTPQQLQAQALMHQRAAKYREREHDREVTLRGLQAGVY